MSLLTAWLLVAGAAGAAGAPVGDVDEFFKTFAEKRASLQFMEGRFVQKHVTDRETVRAEGRIVFSKPRRILFRFESAEQNATYIIDGRRAYEYEPDIRQLQIYDLEENQQTEVFFLGFDDNIAGLRQGYDVGVIEPEDKELGRRALIIHPKKQPENAEKKDPAEGRARQGGDFREIAIYLREPDYVPSRIHILKEDGSDVDIQLYDIALRDKADLNAVSIAVPEGTKIVENDGKPETVGAGGKTLPPAEPSSAAPAPSAVTVQELAPAAKPAP